MCDSMTDKGSHTSVQVVVDVQYTCRLCGVSLLNSKGRLQKMRALFGTKKGKPPMQPLWRRFASIGVSLVDRPGLSPRICEAGCYNALLRVEKCWSTLKKWQAEHNSQAQCQAKYDTAFEEEDINEMEMRTSSSSPSDSGIPPSINPSEGLPINHNEGLTIISLSEGPPINPPDGPPINPPDGPPINPPDGPPINPPDGPPINPPDGPPINPPDGPPINPPDGPPINPPDGPPINPPDGPPINPPDGPPINPPDGPPINPPDGPPINPPDGPPINPPDGPPINPPDGPPINPPDGPPINPPDGPPINPPDGPPINPSEDLLINHNEGLPVISLSEGPPINPFSLKRYPAPQYKKRLSNTEVFIQYPSKRVRLQCDTDVSGIIEHLAKGKWRTAAKQILLHSHLVEELKPGFLQIVDGECRVLCDHKQSFVLISGLFHSPPWTVT